MTARRLAIKAFLFVIVIIVITAISIWFDTGARVSSAT